MQLYGIKERASSKRAGIIFGLFCIACSLAFALAVYNGADITKAYAQGKKAGPQGVLKPQKAAQASVPIEEERLKILNADLQAKIEELKKLKAEVEEISKGFDAKRKGQLVKVVKMYEAMPSEEAAKALAKLDDDTAVQILTSLKARAAGQILGQMDPDRVAILSKKALLRGKNSKEKSSR
jgi:flagellar motility protein MotE (MotC chaperone)